MKKSVKYILWTLVVVALIVFILVRNKKMTETNTTLARGGATEVAVETITVSSETYSNAFSSNGTLEPIRELSFVSDASGRILEILAEKGLKVAKGQTLIKVDDEMLRADFMASEAAYNALKTDYERFKNANEAGGVTSQQLDNINTQLIAAESRYIASKRRLQDASIKAPIAGTINQRYVEIGSLLSPGARLFDIVDETDLKVWCNVPEKRVLELEKGQSVQLTCSSFPGESYTGKITFIGLKTDKGLNYPIEITIDEKDKKELKAGMYVAATFEGATQKTGILIPRKAITGSVKTASVFVVNNGIAEKRDISIGDMVETRVEIVDGLKEGDVLIVSGLINVSEGSKVKLN